MDSTKWAALVGAAASIAVFIGGAWASSLKDRAADRAAAVKEGRAAVQELLQAALDVKAAMTTWDARQRDRRSIVTAWVHSVAQVLDGLAEDRVYRGVAEGLGSVMTWRRGIDSADEANVLGSTSRMAAAAARIAMLDDAGLRQASSEVTDALAQFVAAYTGRARPAVRARADRKVEEAIGSLGDAARAYSGRPGRRRRRS